MKITLDDYKLMEEREYSIFEVENTYTKRLNTLRKIDNEKPLKYYIDINHNITDNIDEAKITPYNYYSFDDSVPSYTKKKRIKPREFRNIAKNNINDSVQELLKKELYIFNKEQKVKENYITDSESFVAVDKPEEWLDCPNCNLKPIIWEFDNGRYTSCGCGEDRYKSFSIRAQSVCSYHKKYGNTAKYNKDTNDLMRNWNHYVLTGEILFEADFDNDLW